MEGRATLTMVMSMMFMNMAATKTTLTLILGLMRLPSTVPAFLSGGYPSSNAGAGSAFHGLGTGPAAPGLQASRARAAVPGLRLRPARAVS